MRDDWVFAIFAGNIVAWVTTVVQRRFFQQHREMSWECFQEEERRLKQDGM